MTFFRVVLLSGLIGIVVGNETAIAAASATDQDKLASGAKISKEVAQNTALNKVPGGVVASSELEREHGKLVWSFDIKRRGSRDITEIQIDAVSGGIVSIQNEDLQAQAKEAAADSKPLSH